MKTRKHFFVKMLLALAIAGWSSGAWAQVTVTGSAGSANGTYTTLKAAFDALNLVTKSQDGKNIVVAISASTTETGTAILSTPLVGSWASLKVYPTSAGLSISGDVTGPLIDLNTADNVTIDGRVNQTGAKDLTISNASVSTSSNTSTIRFINDACNNTVKYCTLKGSTKTANCGILLFGVSTATGNGNDNNLIDHNDITNAADANRPGLAAIYGLGTTGQDNSENTISNNNIYDFSSRSSTNSYGICLMGGNTAWTITGNSIYETASLVPTSNTSYYPIYINSTTSGLNITVSNNYIGGSAPLCGGSAWTKTNSFNNAFIGISVSVINTTASNVSGNIITNFDWSNSGNASGVGIAATGNVNVGTATAGNTIGASTGNGAIKFNTGTDNGAFTGISANTGFTGNIQNNTVASITVSNTDATLSTNFTGISIVGNTGIIANNTIGSLTTANSINATSASTSGTQKVYGINSSSTFLTRISGNTVANMTNGTTNTTTTTTGLIHGIYAGGGSNQISNNTILNLTISNANNATTSAISICGITLNYLSSTGFTQSITGNTIYNLSNTYASFTGAVIGLYYGGTTTPGVVSGNFIHSLSVNSSSTGAAIYGIKHDYGATTYANNIIKLGGNTPTTLYGIYDNSYSSSHDIKLYNNTVYLSGTLASGSTNKSYAIYSYRNSNIRNIRNNVLSNARSTTGGSSLHYAIWFNYGTSTNLTLGYNNYYVSGTGGVLGYYNSANVTALPLITSLDASSTAINPNFASAGGTSALNYYPSATLTGVSGTGILVDYSNYIRNATPRKGALEFSSAPAGSNAVSVYNGALLLASYVNIKEAFAKINDGTHTGSLILKITASQTLSSSAVLNASGIGSANYTDVTVYPTASGLTISAAGNFSEPLIDLNGADNVVIDGRVNATGSSKSLTITNPSISGSTIRFINDACANTIKYCTLKGSSTNTYEGILWFGTTNGTSGNNNNLIDNNDITNAADANRPSNAIFSYGISSNAGNSENTISNNNIYDFLNRSIASNGISLSGYSKAWTIAGNSFYETTTFAPTAGASYNVINITNSITGENFTVSGNYIGGSAPLCGGAAWTKTAGNDNPFVAINCNTGSVLASNIQGNAIKNINFSNSANASWYGIYVGNGIVNIGTITGNTIGAATGNGSIVLTNSTGGTFTGIYTNGQAIVQNNLIGGITAACSGTNNGTNFTGIQSQGSATTIKNNTIGSTDAGTTNSIYLSSPAAAFSQVAYGIYSSCPAAVITGNTLAKMTNGTTNATASTTGVISGIYIGIGSNTIANNTICDLTIASANNSTTNTASVGGIVLQCSTTGLVQNIIGNTIYNLSNTYTSFGGAVTGIYYYGGTTPGKVSGNFIHSLSVNAGSTVATLYGINIAGGTTTYSNNVISLGGNTQTNIYGIYEPGTASNNNSLYFNTVYISGTAGNNRSVALYSNAAANVRDFRNNIFCNTRSTSGGTSLHYAAYFNYAVNTNLTLDNNDYYASGTGGKLGYYNGADVTSLPLITTLDANSTAVDPTFASAGGTAVLNYYPSVTLTGVTGTGTLTDLNEYYRSASSPKMGALESTSTSNAVDIYVGETLQSSVKNIATAFDKINDGIYTGAITLKITGSQVLSTKATLNASGMGNANYTSITVYPTVTGLSISGNLPTPLIDLNGADNVVIDGRVNAIGTAKDLIVTNENTTAIAGTSTIRFINGACGNTVKYCTVKGSETSTAGGVIYFSSTSGTTGNDNNTIDNNNITCTTDANRPINAILSTGTLNAENSNITISNNNIFDFLNRNNISYGINIYQNSTAWNISGNSLYETTTFVPTASVSYYGIYINPGTTSSQSFTISANYIGGSAPLCGGSPWTKTNASTNNLMAIYLNVGTETTSNVQGNTIKNFDFSNTGNGLFCGIYCLTGSVNVGTTVGNVIGSATGNGSITVTNGSNGIGFYGINFASSTGNIDVRNNTIGSITTASNNNSTYTALYGIYRNNTATTTISNNSIGSTDAGTTNSLNATSTASSQVVYGIHNVSGGELTISGNTISKLTNNTSGSGFLAGIYSSNGAIGNISSNFITDLLTPNTGNAIFGIYVYKGIGTIANNIVGLSGTTSNSIYGIYDEGNAGTDYAYYFNTVNIGGSIVGLGMQSFAFFTTATGVRDIRNNIFNNTRTTAGTNVNYAAKLNITSSSNLTLNNNNYYVSGTGSVLGYYNGANATSLPLVSGLDGNSTNLNPNFVNTSESSVAGYVPTANVSTAVVGTGITTDYSGITRSNSIPTLGALELFTWTGATGSNWNSAANWSTNLVPGATDNVLVPNVTNNPVVNSGANCNNISLLPAATLTLNAAPLTVSGNLYLKSDATGTATLVDGGNTVSIAGTTNVEQYLTSGRVWYLSSPVSAATSASILTASGSSNMAGYDESNGSAASNIAWPAAASILAIGKGYVLSSPTASAAITFTGGTLNTGAQSVALTRTAGQTKEGFNLVGNPYPSYLNAMTAINANANVDKTIWYRTKGASAYVFETVNTTSGAGTNLSGTGAVTGYIPPMQSFWVRATAATTSLDFANTDRSHATGTTTLLKAPTVANQLLRLQVSNGTNNDEALIYFNANAADGLDNYDSKKMSNGDASVPEIYTTVGGEKLVINGMKNIPTNELTLGLTPGQASTFTIKATEFSNFDANMHVFLKDKLLGTEQDLTATGAYTFTTSVASVADRFSVVFKSAGSTTGTIDANDNPTVSVYRNAANQIAVQLQSAVSSDAVATVFNSLGQRLESTPLKNATTIVGKSLTSGAYVVTVTNGGKTVTRKITIN